MIEKSLIYKGFCGSLKIYLTQTAAKSRLPFRKSATFPCKKSLFSGANPSSVTFWLLRYAPPSLTIRRAADFESTTPVATNRSTQLGISFNEIEVDGNS